MLGATHACPNRILHTYFSNTVYGISSDASWYLIYTALISYNCHPQPVVQRITDNRSDAAD